MKLGQGCQDEGVLWRWHRPADPKAVWGVVWCEAVGSGHGGTGEWLKGGAGLWKA